MVISHGNVVAILLITECRALMKWMEIVASPADRHKQGKHVLLYVPKGKNRNNWNIL